MLFHIFLASMKEYRMKNIENTLICEEDTVKQSLEVNINSFF